jgi:hypothetical protein
MKFPMVSLHGLLIQPLVAPPCASTPSEEVDEILRRTTGVDVSESIPFLRSSPSERSC